MTAWQWMAELSGRIRQAGTVSARGAIIAAPCAPEDRPASILETNKSCTWLVSGHNSRRHCSVSCYCCSGIVLLYFWTQRTSVQQGNKWSALDYWQLSVARRVAASRDATSRGRQQRAVRSTRCSTRVCPQRVCCVAFALAATFPRGETLDHQNDNNTSSGARHGDRKHLRDWKRSDAHWTGISIALTMGRSQWVRAPHRQLFRAPVARNAAR